MLELTKLRLEFDQIVGYENREFNDIFWNWVKDNSAKICELSMRMEKLDKERKVYLLWNRGMLVGAYDSREKAEENERIMNIDNKYTMISELVLE